MRIPTFVLILLASIALLSPADVVFAYPPAQVSSCTTASPSPDPTVGPTPTVCISDVIVNADGASPQNRFSVSWVSVSPEAGQVQLVGGGTFNDERSATFAGTTHYVQLNNLQSNTTYQFDIVSGGKTYTNNGQHWSVAIGPALTPSAPFNILGRVKNPDGSDADEALVYVTIQRADGAFSSLLSQIMTSDDGGFFHLNLSDARTTDYSSRFSFNPSSDKLTITAIGPTGAASWTGKTGDPRPGKPTLFLTLGSGGGTAATSTPSPIPSTSTPTPVTPTATQTLPPATATALAATETATALAPTPTFTPVPAVATAVRPTATRQLFIEPTLTVPLITIQPAATTSAQATLANPEEGTPEPFTTRVIRLATATPEATSTFAGITSSSSLFAVLAAVAFIGAAFLGIAALYLWKR